MFYALNLFNVEDHATYRKYLTTAGPIVQELGGDLVVMFVLDFEHLLFLFVGQAELRQVGMLQNADAVR